MARHEPIRPSERYPEVKVNTHTLGAIGELRAAVWLLEHGWEVFRQITYDCSCDLIGIKNGQVYRFEVRTAVEAKNGKPRFSKDHIYAENLIAVVLPGGKIFCIPEVPVPVQLIIPKQPKTH